MAPIEGRLLHIIIIVVVFNENTIKAEVVLFIYIKSNAYIQVYGSIKKRQV